MLFLGITGKAKQNKTRPFELDDDCNRSKMIMLYMPLCHFLLLYIASLRSRRPSREPDELVGLVFFDDEVIFTNRLDGTLLAR